jgi:predicted nucleic acid-binding Zn ribbon protein
MLRPRMSLPPRRHIPPLGPPKLSARERVLAAWRGAQVVRSEKASARSVTSADQAVARLFKDLRMDRRQAEAEIARSWNSLIDPTITAHAQPVGLNKGTLFVNVDNNVWLSEIVRYRRREILDRLQHAFGREMIARISFRIG